MTPTKARLCCKCTAPMEGEALLCDACLAGFGPVREERGPVQLPLLEAAA